MMMQTCDRPDGRGVACGDLDSGLERGGEGREGLAKDRTEETSKNKGTARVR